MHQDVTWYDGRLRPMQHCVRCGPMQLHRRRCTAPNFGPCLLWPNGWMDQDATWYEGRPRPRPHCVTRRPSSPAERGMAAPTFRPMSVVAKRSPILATAELFSSMARITNVRLTMQDGSKEPVIGLFDFSFQPSFIAEQLLINF